MNYRDGIHRCWFDMIIARDLYRDWSTRCSIPMHKDIILRYVSTLCIMMAPITPHWCEHIWKVIGERTKDHSLFSFIHQTSSVCDASWPTSSTPCDMLIRKQYVFFREVMKNARQASIKSKVATEEKCAIVLIAQAFDEKKEQVLRYLSEQCDANGQFPADILKSMKAFFEGK